MSRKYPSRAVVSDYGLGKGQRREVYILAKWHGWHGKIDDYTDCCPVIRR